MNSVVVVVVPVDVLFDTEGCKDPLVEVAGYTGHIVAGAMVYMAVCRLLPFVDASDIVPILF